MALFDTLSNTIVKNATATLHALLKALRANVTRATVQESVEKHPDFPSLLSLSDVLTSWQADNTGLQLNTPEQLRELPFPFIAHLRKNNGWYVLVTALQGDRITYTDNEEGRKKESLTDFETKWSGVVLLAETNEQSGEAEYTFKRKQEVLQNLRVPFVLAGVLLVSLVVILNIAEDFTTSDWLLLLTKSIGLALSILLVNKQLGGKNALVDRLCQINAKTNCDDVLNSPAAKLWGWLSWTDVGLLYFSGSLLTVLMAGAVPELRLLLCCLALLALPYTVFSVHYQARVLRQWCPLCLGVQGILFADGILAVMQLNSFPNSTQPYLLTLTAFLLPTLAWVAVKPLLINLPKSRREHEELMRLRRDPNLFRALLMQQPKMPPGSADLRPIVLGNSEAEHTITMVTNPYCGPCAKTHKDLNELLRCNDNVNAAIIFTCDGTNGLTTQMAIHIMALTQQGKAALALADWYEQPEKNFDSWAKRYPVTPSQIDWMVIANKQRDWCQIAHITATPTLFVDGYQLPKQYELDGLRWLINGLELLNTEPATRI